MLKLRSNGLISIAAATGLTLGLCTAGADDTPRRDAAAAEIAIEHAKLNTADASPVDCGQVELEIGYSWSEARRAWDAEGVSFRRGLAREQAVGLSATVGVAPNVDVGVSLDHLWLRDDDNGYPTTARAFSDLGFGGRYRFFTSEAHAVEAAWISGFTAPTASRGDERDLGVSQEFWTWENSLVVTKDWERLTMNAELGWVHPFGADRGDERGGLLANFAMGYQILSWLQPELELNYERGYAKEGDEPNLLAVTAGLVMPLNDCLRVNLGVQQCVWAENADKTTTAVLAVKAGF